MQLLVLIYATNDASNSYVVDVIQFEVIRNPALLAQVRPPPAVKCM